MRYKKPELLFDDEIINKIESKFGKIPMVLSSNGIIEIDLTEDEYNGCF